MQNGISTCEFKVCEFSPVTVEGSSMPVAIIVLLTSVGLTEVKGSDSVARVALEMPFMGPRGTCHHT